LNPVSYEVELIALAALFYLYDSSVLLYSNEAILSFDGARRWSATSGTGLMFAGRALRILNPFTPYRPAFRLHWDFETLDSGLQDLAWSERAEQFPNLAAVTVTAGIALFVLLPLGLLTDLGAYAVVPALVLLYGSILLALILVNRARGRVSMSRQRFWALAFECLACPPFGVNLVRHFTLAERIAEPLPLAGARLLDAGRWDPLRDICVSRVEAAIERVAEDSAERSRLEAQRQRLSTLVSRR
jgi:hypothetical protein